MEYLSKGSFNAYDCKNHNDTGAPYPIQIKLPHKAAMKVPRQHAVRLVYNNGLKIRDFE
jgi:hypothetical protein